MLSVYAKIGYILLLVLIVAFIVALTILANVYERRERRKRTEGIEALKERFGIVDFAQSGEFTRITLQTEAYGGTLRATSSKGGHSFKTIQFEGNCRVSKSSWSLMTRRSDLLSMVEGEPVELPSPELQKRFKLITKHPDELRSFFDAETEQLLIDLDLGLLPMLFGQFTGVSIRVAETWFSVQIHGQQGDDIEFLRRVLRLIERVAEYGQSDLPTASA